MKSNTNTDLFDQAQLIYEADPEGVVPYLQTLSSNKIIGLGICGVSVQAPLMSRVLDVLQERQNKYLASFWGTFRHWGAVWAMHNDIDLVEKLHRLTQTLQCDKQVWGLNKNDTTVVCPLIAAATSSAYTTLNYLKTPQPSEENLLACVYACDVNDLQAVQILIKDNTQSIIPQLLNCPTDPILQLVLNNSPNLLGDFKDLITPHLPAFNRLYPGLAAKLPLRGKAHLTFWKVTLMDRVYGALSPDDHNQMRKPDHQHGAILSEHVEDFFSQSYIQSQAPNAQARKIKDALNQEVQVVATSSARPTSRL